jgi:hypothetical protein
MSNTVHWFTICADVLTIVYLTTQLHSWYRWYFVRWPDFIHELA